MLGYVQGTARPDIAMPAHQCARFNIGPRLSLKRALKRIGRYLLNTKDKGMIFRPDTSRGLECYVDADFTGGWKDGNHVSPESVLSRTGLQSCLLVVQLLGKASFRRKSLSAQQRANTLHCRLLCERSSRS